MSIYSFSGVSPVIHATAFVHPQASIIGDVWIEEDCYIGPFASLRGDFNRIIVKRGSNVQDCCVLHGYPSIDCVLEENSHIGHGAIIHSAVVKKNAMVGMHSVVMDLAEIGENSIVAANSLVVSKYKVPKNTLVAGSPCKIIKQISPETIKLKQIGTENYQELAKRSNFRLQEIDRKDALDTNNRSELRTSWQEVPMLSTKTN